MEEKLLSIIIPAYNAQKYIEECLRSLPAEYSHCYEAIVIDDGSKDNTKQIIEKCQKTNPAIQYIAQENSGVSAARNHGLRLAQGEYITFLDADDEWKKEEFIRIFDDLRTKKTDFRIYNYYEIDEKGKKITEHDLAAKMKNEHDIYRQMLEGFYLNACWGKVYRKEMITRYKMQFDTTMRVGEDLVFVCEYLKKSRTVEALSYSFYGYRQTEQNTMNTTRNHITTQSCADMERMIECKLGFLKKKFQKEEELGRYLRKESEVIIANINIALKSQAGFKKELSEINRFLEGENVKYVMQNAARVNQIIGKRKMAIVCMNNKITRYMYTRVKYSKYHRKNR